MQQKAGLILCISSSVIRDVAAISIVTLVLCLFVNILLVCLEAESFCIVQICLKLIVSLVQPPKWYNYSFGIQYGSSKDVFKENNVGVFRPYTDYHHPTYSGLK